MGSTHCITVYDSGQVMVVGSIVLPKSPLMCPYRLLIALDTGALIETVFTSDKMFVNATILYKNQERCTETNLTLWTFQLICMVKIMQIRGSAYCGILRLRPIDSCALQGSVSAEFCGKQWHEIGPRCVCIYYNAENGSQSFYMKAYQTDLFCLAVWYNHQLHIM